ncbi:1-acyl-sn-glycerol-3-phosphate acyltransferase [Campylobacter sp. FMV-PI01]|uniref:1-acyl-sn-glycerol-3-phosphate acyltransferase n=1 Tax=Campylobacter portucalensis TaxID=2608384 RepID=A0A6L5WFS5_9BACT|nr:lysophospholipid acyltransferase family protein [Campylobacter portucalensis]MSN95948.1 1-acyl-sn-glycerol-3-phosphate acyltransferase [Campylobacter portucalensis]
MEKFKGGLYFIWFVFSIAIVVISMSIFKTKILSIRRGWSKMQRFALGYKVEKIGEFDEEANLILINHKSMVDIMILEEFHPKNLAWVAKKEIGDIFFLGKILSLPNMISIDRNNPRSIVGLIKDAKDRVKNGRVIAIFPEGTRGRGDKILKFQDGAKVVAKKLNLRVQPIVLKDTLQILNVKEFTVKKGLVKMKCLEVVDLNDENWYEKTRLNMQKAYDEL